MLDLNLLMGVSMGGYGIFCLYQWIATHFYEKDPGNNSLVPQGSTMADCLDREAFLAEAMPLLLIFGIVMTVVGGAIFADVYLGFIEPLMALLPDDLQMPVLVVTTFVLPFAVLIWFTIALRRVQKKFF